MKTGKKNITDGLITDIEPKNIKKTWVITEIKDTVRDIATAYYLSKNNYVKSLTGFADMKKARSEYISDLINFFAPARAFIINYIKSHHKETNIILQDYVFLPLKHSQYSDDKLYLMGDLLEEWYWNEGYFRINQIEQQFDSALKETLYEDV